MKLTAWWVNVLNERITVTFWWIRKPKHAATVKNTQLTSTASSENTWRWIEAEGIKTAIMRTLTNSSQWRYWNGNGCTVNELPSPLNVLQQVLIWNWKKRLTCPWYFGHSLPSSIGVLLFVGMGWRSRSTLESGSYVWTPLEQAGNALLAEKKITGFSLISLLQWFEEHDFTGDSVTGDHPSLGQWFDRTPLNEQGWQNVTLTKLPKIYFRLK